MTDYCRQFHLSGHAFFCRQLHVLLFFVCSAGTLVCPDEFKMRLLCLSMIFFMHEQHETDHRQPQHCQH